MGVELQLDCGITAPYVGMTLRLVWYSVLSSLNLRSRVITLPYAQKHMEGSWTDPSEDGMVMKPLT